MAYRTEQLVSDASYSYQSADIAVELHTEKELEKLISALQNSDNAVVLIRNHHRSINIHFYMRFRER